MISSCPGLNSSVIHRQEIKAVMRIINSKRMTTMRSSRVMIMIFLATFSLIRADSMFYLEAPTNVTAIVGHEVVQKCRVPPNKGNMYWSKDGVTLGLEDDRDLMAYPRYSILGRLSNGESHLRIRNLSVEDEGSYSCIVSPSSGAARGLMTGYLNVIVPPGDPSIEGERNESTLVFDGSSSQLSLKCSSGFSKPQTRLSWRKNGVDFESFLSRQSVSMTKLLTITESVLTFHPTPSDDGATLTCVSSHQGNFGSVKSTSVKLVVYYPPARVEISGVQSSMPLISGRTVALTCTSVGGNPLPNLTWKKESIVMTDQRQVVSGSRVTSKINFIVYASDNGATLTCEANSQASASVITSTKLAVFFSPTQTQVLPQIGGRLNAQESRELTVQCKTNTSNPVSKILWFISRTDGNCELEELKDHTLAVEAGDYGGHVSSSTLRLIPKFRDHGARLTCRAENPQTGGFVNNTIAIDVAYKPRFLAIKNFTAKEGTTASLSVLVEANPEAHSFMWIIRHQQIGPIYTKQPATFLQSDMRLSAGVKVIIGESDSSSQPVSRSESKILQEAWLNISHVSREDAGFHVLQATNSEGKSEIQIFVDVLYPAQVISSSAELIFVEGGAAKLQCSFRGNPLPAKVQWFRNGLEMVVGGGEEVVVTSVDEFGHRGRSSLEYKSARHDLIGVYQCMVNNGVSLTSDTSSGMRFVVQHKPRIDKSSIYRRAAAQVNGTARLKCVAHGIPHVDFEWNKVNDSMPPKYLLSDDIPSPIDDTSVLLPSDFSYESHLEILDVQERDYGLYFCRAHNSLGGDESHVLLDRPGPPDPPYNVQFLNSTHNSITLSWQAGFDGGSVQTFAVKCKGHLTHSHDLTVDDVTSPLETVVFTVRGLEMNKEYLVTVSSSNKLGVSPRSSSKPILASTSAAPVSDKSALQVDMSIFVYILASLLIVVILIILVICIVKRTRRKSFKDSSKHGNMGKPSKVSSVETTTTNATLDLIGTPSLVDDLHFKTMDSLSSNVNFGASGGVDCGRIVGMSPKYGCGHDRVSQTHSNCDLDRCTEYDGQYADDEAYNGRTRVYQNNFTPTSSLLSASRTKVTVNPMHLLPSCVTDATDAISRLDNGRDDMTGVQCYVPTNSCMTSSSILPDLHSCTYRSKDMYPYNTINPNRNYSPNHPTHATTSSHSSYYGLPMELRGHLV